MGSWVHDRGAGRFAGRWFRLRSETDMMRLMKKWGFDLDGSFLFFFFKILFFPAKHINDEIPK